MNASSTSPAANGSRQARRVARVLYYDVLNVAACLAVLLLHFNGLAHAYSPTFAWLQALAVECTFYWAVPIFFMLSGATLLRYRERYDTVEFLKKRFSRTVVPFLAWSLLALVWKVGTGQMPAPMGPRTVINLILNTQIIDVYWFFIPLFALYLSFPVLSLLCDGSHDRTLWYLVGVAFVCNSVLPCVLPMVGIQLNPSLMLPVAAGYLIYPVLGYLLSKTDLTRVQRMGIYVVGLVSLVLRYTATVVDSYASHELAQPFWGYTYFPCLLLSVAVFVFARQVRWSRIFGTPRRERILARVAGGSFGVYLLHMVFFWYALQVTGLDGGRLSWRTVMPFVAYATCLAITLVLKRIPVIRRLVP